MVEVAKFIRSPKEGMESYNPYSGVIVVSWKFPPSTREQVGLDLQLNWVK